MSQIPKTSYITLMAIGCAFMLGSCRPPAVVDVPLSFEPTMQATETPFVPTPLPPAPKTLIVCMAEEPDSLFVYHPDVMYGEASEEAHTILQAIYDGPVDLISYEVQPIILEELPTLSNGGVSLRVVALNDNEVFFNPVTLQPENLRVGDRYLPAGCNAPDCLATYAGGEVQMDQMVVDFRLSEGLMWSDGQPLNVSDSFFSYTLDSRGEIPTTKFLVDRTSDYRVMDELTVRWVGIPGFMDSDYQTNFWSPLPEHLLSALPVDELLDAETVNRSPIGWGPYIISSWEPGEITLTPNDLYRAGIRNQPAFARVIFRFLDRGGDHALQQILTDECDIVDESLLSVSDLPSAEALDEEGRVRLWSAADAQLVRLDFNLAPVDRNRPAFFQELRTRQAIAQCIDRSQIQSILASTSGALPTTYINVNHPTVSADVELVSYDPEAGKALLEQIGWVLDEDNPESPRVAFGVPGIRTATPFSVSLLVPETEEMLAVAGLVKADLEACGLSVKVTEVPPEELGEPWPDGLSFGRSYDLVIWSWPEWVSPLCEMFAGWEIPSSAQPYGINATGYQSEAYDAACISQFLSIPGKTGYQEAIVETQQIFNQDIPSLPLFQPPRWIATDMDLCGVVIDGLAGSTLWNLEVLDSGESCP